jgi:hypothetical protein
MESWFGYAADKLFCDGFLTEGPGRPPDHGIGFADVSL